LLRDATVTAIDPPAPPLATLLPLDPATDVYLPSIAAGAPDPDPDVLLPDRPLIFYALDPDRVLRLVRDGTQVRILY
jgi:hypothetical protein